MCGDSYLKMWAARPYATSENFEMLHFQSFRSVHFTIASSSINSGNSSNSPVCHLELCRPWRWMNIKFNIRLSQTLITFRRYFIVQIMIFAVDAIVVVVVVGSWFFVLRFLCSMLHLALNPYRIHLMYTFFLWRTDQIHEHWNIDLCFASFHIFFIISRTN